jgi:hypothetical protein
MAKGASRAVRSVTQIIDPDRVGRRSGKGPPPAVRPRGKLLDPTVCERCGVVFTRKKWQALPAPSATLLRRAAWGVCPACRKVAGKEGLGRVRIEGSFVGPNVRAIRARIANVAERAAYTDPERRVASIEQTPEGLDVITTSQELAHRIARELTKAFRGRATYAWSDQDGSLFARWRRDEPAPTRSRPARRSR